MTDQEEPPEQGASAAEQGEQAGFAIRKIYTKDISFESPGAPGVFSETWQPDVDLDLSTLEMSFGLHGRIEIPRLELQYVTLGAGVTLLRSESVLPPDNERGFVGPYAGAGWEGYFLGKFLVGLEGRYGLMAYGPKAITLNISLSFGTK